MQIQRILVPLGAIALLAGGYRTAGWAGLALAAGALVMWLLLHMTRLMQVLKRAAQRPVGYVDSAVMLNAKLRKGVTLLHVIALTRSLGEQRSEKGSQPEVFRWTDNSSSHVTATFAGGKLTLWQLQRPEPVTAAEPQPAALPAAGAGAGAP